MKVAVVGSRSFADSTYMHDKLTGILWDIVDHWGNDLPLDITIISGGARGADSLAEQWAKKWGYETNIFPAEWDKYGKSAGYKRNELIVQECDILVAFWDGESRGTKHSMDLAVKYNKPVFKFTDWKGNE